MIEGFSISLEGMKDISSKLTSDFEKGLAREGDDVVVKMLITYVHSLPDGTEKGAFLALDLGGSNFRVLLISTKSFDTLRMACVTCFVCCLSFLLF